MAKRIFLTDKEVAAVLEVSVKTLYRMLNGFYRKAGVAGGNRIDVKSIAPDRVNGARRWRVDRVAAALNVSRDEIMERIS